MFRFTVVLVGLTFCFAGRWILPVAIPILVVGLGIAARPFLEGFGVSVFQLLGLSIILAASAYIMLIAIAGASVGSLTSRTVLPDMGVASVLLSAFGGALLFIYLRRYIVACCTAALGGWLIVVGLGGTSDHFIALLTLTEFVGSTLTITSGNLNAATN